MPFPLMGESRLRLRYSRTQPERGCSGTTDLDLCFYTGEPLNNGDQCITGDWKKDKSPAADVDWKEGNLHTPSQSMQ